MTARKRRGVSGARLLQGALLAALAAAGITLGARQAAAEGDRNACGCYQDSAGNCYCDKKAKCGCPGQCEPKGCEEQRQKQMEKEIQAEMKRAQDSSRKDTDKGESAPAAAAADAAGKKAAPAAKPGRKLSAQQRRDLARLLDLYIAEHPGDNGKSVDEVARDLKSAAP